MPGPALVGAPAGAPAGVAAPALTAATKLIPTAPPRTTRRLQPAAPLQRLSTHSI